MLTGVPVDAKLHLFFETFHLLFENFMVADGSGHQERRARANDEEASRQGNTASRDMPGSKEWGSTWS
jgi:hypothetical protein